MDARSYALDVLVRVFGEHGYAGLLMRNESGLADKDKRFVSTLVYGTIRNYTLLEAQWKKYAKRKVRLKTALNMDMAVYQMFFLDKVPDYAIVNAAVSMADEKEKGFVNALLHKVQKQGFVQYEEEAVRYSHPEWIIGLWKAHYGEEVTKKILESDQKPSTTFGRINTLKADKKELEKRYTFVNDISFTSDVPIQETEDFARGKVLIQDIHSSMVPAFLCVQPGMQVLDACAAPGTKTQEIAMLMENEGEIIASDIYEARVHLIGQLMEKTGVTIVKAVVNDACKKDVYALECFDRILLDVPCSGLGDLSHKPEIRWHLLPENIDALLKTQREILLANAPYLKKGGMMVYSTCTLNKKENEKQIAWFLKEHPDFTLLCEKTMFPFEDGGDGFYMAQLCKTK